MKVYTIEIADAIERELKAFLKDWGGGYPMRFTRFIDLGGKQTDLYVYPAEKGSPPWMIVRIKSVTKTEQGECIQVFVSVAGKPISHEEVLVSPEIWKLPALADRVLAFAKNDLLTKVGEGSGSLEASAESERLASGSSGSLGSGSAEDEDEDLEDLDTSGILAADDAGGESDFNPADFVAQANAGGDEDADDGDDAVQLFDEEQEESEDEPKQ